MTKTLVLERDTANDIIVTPPEPIEYTYTYPTGKQVHVEVSDSGYTTLSTNVTLNENRTVTADLINGTIYCNRKIIFTTPTNYFLYITVNEDTYYLGNPDYYQSSDSISNYIEAIVHSGDTVTVTILGSVKGKMYRLGITSSNDNCIPSRTSSRYNDSPATLSYTFTMPNEDISVEIQLV